MILLKVYGLLIVLAMLDIVKLFLLHHGTPSNADHFCLSGVGVWTGH